MGGVYRLNEINSLTRLHIISHKTWNHQNEDVCGCLIGFISWLYGWYYMRGQEKSLQTKYSQLNKNKYLLFAKKNVMFFFNFWFNREKKNRYNNAINLQLYNIYMTMMLSLCKDCVNCLFCSNAVLHCFAEPPDIGPWPIPNLYGTEPCRYRIAGRTFP